MTYYQPALMVFFLLTGYGLLRRRLRMALIGLVLLFLWSWAPFAWLLSGTLEWFYRQGIPSGDAQAIVVLSSGAVDADSSIPEPYVGWDTYQRCKHAAWLYHHWHAVPVVASGGPVQSGAVLARLMKSALEAEGVPSSSIWTEEESRSTYENGTLSAALLRSRGIHKIALVTEAHHMLRSDRIFRKQGMEVIPAPCAAYTSAFRPTMDALFPSGRPIIVNNNVLHEWVGLAWYRLRGWI